MHQQISSIPGKVIAQSRDVRKSNMPTTNNLENVKIIEVETLFLGGGPATLGIISNAYQTNRLDELLRGVHTSKPGCVINDLLQNPHTNYGHQGKTTVGQFIGQQNKEQTNDILKKQHNVQSSIKRNGIAIVDINSQFGGGNLTKHFGVKSNTSATGFLKVLMYPKSQTKHKVTQQQITQAINQQNNAVLNQPLRNNAELALANQKQFSQTSNGLHFAQKQGGKPQPIIGPGIQGAHDVNIQKIKEEKQRMFLPFFETFAESSELVKSLQKYGKKVAPLQLIGTFLSYAGNAVLNDIWQRYQKKIFYGNHYATKIKQV